jgi:hypothetical protein
VCQSCAVRIDRRKRSRLVAGTLATAAFGLYLVTRGHGDAPSVPSAVPDRPAQAAAQPPVSSQAIQPTPSPANAFGGQVPSLASAADAAMPADSLAATVQRLRVARAQGQEVPNQFGQSAALVPPSGSSAETTSRLPDGGASPPTTPTDNPVSTSAQSSATQRQVTAGRHTTATGVRWSLVNSGNTPSLVVDMGNGKEATVKVGAEFMKLDLHAMSRNVEHVSSLILGSYMGEAGNYLFTTDGRLFRTE